MSDLDNKLKEALGGPDAVAQIKQVFIEALGEDVWPDQGNTHRDWYLMAWGKNELRKELRGKLK